jgi:hypothetical protein
MGQVDLVDAERIAAVSESLGARRFEELLDILAVRLQRVSTALETLPADAAGLAFSLHQSRGSAASLGLVGLAAALTDIEAQIAGAPSGSAPMSNPAALAGLKSAGHALQGAWQAALLAATRHGAKGGQNQASGICST